MTNLEKMFCAVEVEGCTVLPQIIVDPLRKFTREYRHCLEFNGYGGRLVDKQCDKCGYSFPEQILTDDSRKSRCPVCHLMHGDSLDRLRRPQALECARQLLSALEDMVRSNRGPVDFVQNPDKALACLRCLHE